MELFLSPPSDCPYLEGRLMQTAFFSADWVEPADYEDLLALNFRRSGSTFYRPHCSGCRQCRQLRVDSRAFVPTESQRRVLRKNRDVRVQLSPRLDAGEYLDLYRRYVVERHGHERPDDEEIADFLGQLRTESFVMAYYLGDALVGAGWIDQVATGLSSVYFAFEPSCASRSLGVHSTLKELELARSLNLPWVYMGFWVEGSRTMDYKNKYYPHEVLHEGTWVRNEGPSS